MTNITVTEREVFSLLNQIVAEFGEDYTYQQNEYAPTTCVYTGLDSQPSCIVGHVLARAGTPLEVLHAIDFGGVVDQDGIFHRGSLADTGIYEDDVLRWLKDNGIVLTEGAARILATVQRAQDDGVEWGKAVKRALAAERIGG